MRTTRSILATAALLALPFAHASAGELKWKAHAINPRSDFEAAGAFDVNGDGKVDVVSGDAWYEAPNWAPHPTREVTRQGTYTNCFSTLPMDVNGDGRVDYVTCGYFTKNVGWVENPGKTGAPWPYHEIDLPGPSETAQLVDLTGDGKPEVLPNAVGRVVWYELETADSVPTWKKHDLGAEAAGHGVGSGDVNGDGRTDLLTPKGWFEAPAKPSTEPWAWHPEWQLGSAGIQILAKDVDGDGLSDVVFGMGHDRGIYWLKQGRSGNGERTWTRAAIDKEVPLPHTLLWADLDGDGKADELLSGTRVYAHETDPGATDAPVVAWYRYEPEGKAWKRRTITLGEPATQAPAEGPKRAALKDFSAGTVGTGLHLQAVDMDGDGDLDILCPGKSGLYWLENLGEV